MKYTHLLVLACCISNINVFSSEKNNEQKSTLDWQSTLRPYKPAAFDIYVVEDLKKKHKIEIELYEQKITAMQLQIDQQALTIKQFQSNK
jgi:hypothetical protein